MSDRTDSQAETFPFQKHSETSRMAAEAAPPIVPSQRKRLLDTWGAAGTYGLTDDDAQQKTGLSQNSGVIRRLELWRAGRLVATTRQRLTRAGRYAVVFVSSAFADDEGTEQLREGERRAKSRPQAEKHPRSQPHDHDPEACPHCARLVQQGRDEVTNRTADDPAQPSLW